MTFNIIEYIQISMLSFIENYAIRVAAPSEALFIEIPPTEQTPETEGITEAEAAQDFVEVTTVTPFYEEPIAIAAGIFIVLLLFFIVFLKLRKKP